MSLHIPPDSLPDISSHQMLKAVRACIYEITTKGQSVSADGFLLTQADLSNLRQLEKDLMDRVAREDASSGIGNARSFQVVF